MSYFKAVYRFPTKHLIVMLGR